MDRDKKKRPAGRRPEASRRDRFARIVTEAIHREVAVEEVTYDPEGFRLSLDGDVLNLENFYLIFELTAPPDRGRLLQQFLRAWFTNVDVPTSFAELKPNLLPNVHRRSDAKLYRLANKPWPDSPCVVLGEHLTVPLVYNLADINVAMTQELLTEVGADFDEAFLAACDNLRAMSRQGLVLRAPGVWQSPWHDDYDAARLILTDLIRRHPVRGDHVAMVPNRQTLLVTGSLDEAGLGLVASLAEKGLSEPWPLSGVALRLQGGSWVPFLPPAGHPSRPLFRRLFLQAMSGAYANQKKLLDTIHEDRGEDIYVSSDRVLCPPTGGEPLSICVLTEGVDSLLPVADGVAFVRPAGEDDAELLGIGAWGRVREVLGPLLEPQQLYPERYRVREFPTVEQLEAIGLCGLEHFVSQSPKKESSEYQKELIIR